MLSLQSVSPHLLGPTLPMHLVLMKMVKLGRIRHLVLSGSRIRVR